MDCDKVPNTFMRVFKTQQANRKLSSTNSDGGFTKWRTVLVSLQLSGLRGIEI